MTYENNKVSEIIVKQGSTLTDEEHEQINKALLREFTVSLPPVEQLIDRLFFILKEIDSIVAFGALLEVNPVYFNDEEFSLLGIVNVVSNIKGKGFGKRVITSMKDYLSTNHITGIGFTKPQNQGFYEKCGFTFTINSTQRFVVKKEDKKITNQDGQFIFYHDGRDEFMQKVLAQPNKEVLVPEPNLW